MKAQLEALVKQESAIQTHNTPSFLPTMSTNQPLPVDSQTESRPSVSLSQPSFERFTNSPHQTQVTRRYSRNLSDSSPSWQSPAVPNEFSTQVPKQATRDNNQYIIRKSTELDLDETF